VEKSVANCIFEKKPLIGEKRRNLPHGEKKRKKKKKKKKKRTRKKGEQKIKQQKKKKPNKQKRGRHQKRTKRKSNQKKQKNLPSGGSFLIRENLLLEEGPGGRNLCFIRVNGRCSKPFTNGTKRQKKRGGVYYGP